MEVLNSESKFPITFERNTTTEEVLTLALRGLSFKNKKLTKQETTKTFEDKNVNSKALAIYGLDEVAKHQDYNSCWIVLYDRVYDVTKFLDLHPGGFDVLFENAGRDATFAFHGIHSNLAKHMLKEYLIGELPEKEKLYRKKTRHSISLSDMPE